MAGDLNAEEFSKHVNTTFRPDLGAEAQVDLELVEVRTYNSNPGDEEGMERFSLFFMGPAQPLLPQRLYSMANDGMGTVDIFLVAIKSDSKGSRYEAVFNLFKTD